MTCQRGTCTAPMREDLSFARDAQTYNIPTRRFYCLLGHSRHVNVIPLSRSLTEREVRGEHPKATRRRCVRVACRAYFVTAGPYDYCSHECRVLSKRERRRATRKPQIKPKDSSQVRYPPKSRWPVPYALPPRNLSMAWT